MIKQYNNITIDDIELVNQQSYIDFLRNGFKPRKDLPHYNITQPIDWNIDPFSDSNWKFQLHSWRNLDPAIIEYKKHHDASTLIFILDTMKSWFHFSIESKHSFLWYDMAVGLRAQKLGLLSNELITLSQNSSTDKEWIFKLIFSHLDELIDSEKFSLNNHGIFQAHGLMALAKAFDFSSTRCNKEISAIALKRMSQLWSNQFYPEGIHSENSPEYHIFAHRKFSKLAATNWYTSIRLDDALLSAKRNFFWLCRPNSQIWPIGDSGISTLKIPEDILEHELLFSPEHNEANFKFFEQSGYFISKSRDKEFGLFISTARRNKVHMHNDDLNFEWYDHGRPIIVDSGKYGYTGCKYRKYYLSQHAHNIILINGESINGSLYDSCLRRVGKMSYGTLVELSHKSIDHSIHNTRILITKKSHFLIVIDRINSSSQVTVEQTFHIHPNFSLENETESNFDYSFIDIKDNLKINVRTLTNNAENNKSILFGDTKNGFSFVSESYREQKPSYLIKNSASVKETVIATLFTTDSKYNIEVVDNVIYINNGSILIDKIDVNI
ncbi:heparinase II/III domain-containing protein [Aeromonas salmonicida]|uniref:heparinase II/III domain-containing protein n=1 Tax=Aeromonas salmonicida TaxID=645 RepID=UPI003D200F99